VLEGDKRHMKLDVEVKAAERNAKSRGVKSTMSGMMVGRRNPTAQYVTNYNTVEAVLLGVTVLVALAGVMFESRRFDQKGGDAGRDALTAVVLLLIIVSIIYFALVVAAEVTESVSPDKFGRIFKCCKAEKSTIELEVEREMMLGRGREPKDADTIVNPMMLKAGKGDGSGAGGALLPADVIAQINQLLSAPTPPTPAQWQTVRGHMVGLKGEITDLNNEIRALKKAQTLAAANKALGREEDKRQAPGQLVKQGTAGRGRGRGRIQFGQTETRRDTVLPGAAGGLRAAGGGGGAASPAAE
jgi:hypothetical protein